MTPDDLAVARQAAERELVAHEEDIGFCVVCENPTESWPCDAARVARAFLDVLSRLDWEDRMSDRGQVPVVPTETARGAEEMNPQVFRVLAGIESYLASGAADPVSLSIGLLQARQAIVALRSRLDLAIEALREIADYMPSHEHLEHAGQTMDAMVRCARSALESVAAEIEEKWEEQ